MTNVLDLLFDSYKDRVFEENYVVLLLDVVEHNKEQWDRVVINLLIGQAAFYKKFYHYLPDEVRRLNITFGAVDTGMTLENSKEA